MNIKTKQSFNLSPGILKQETVRNKREWTTDFTDVQVSQSGEIESFLKRKRFELAEEQIIFLDKTWTLYSGCGFLKDVSENYIIDSFSFPFENEFKEQFNKEFLTHGIKGKKHINGILFHFSNVGYENYYHVLTELLPRLEFFMPFKGKAKLAISETIPSYLIDAFRLMGIGESDTFVIKHGIEYSADCIITQPWGMNFIPERIQFLKASLNKDSAKEEKLKRIYISRKNEKTRHILNEEELLPVLSSFNFECVFADKMSLKEQIKLFKNTEFVIGPHGAGLSNSVFMDRPFCVEIRPNGYQNDCMKHLALINGAKEFYTVNANLKDEQLNMSLDPEVLKKVLKKIFATDY